MGSSEDELEYQLLLLRDAVKIRNKWLEEMHTILRELRIISYSSVEIGADPAGTILEIAEFIAEKYTRTLVEQVLYLDEEPKLGIDTKNEDES